MSRLCHDSVRLLSIKAFPPTFSGSAVDYITLITPDLTDRARSMPTTSKVESISSARQAQPGIENKKLPGSPRDKVYQDLTGRA